MTNYRRVAARKARKYGLNPRIFKRQIQQESGFNPRARSPAGARGIAQIMPATARGWGVNPDRPRQALDAAARNMAGYVRQFGNYEDALRAYNAGPGNVQRSHGFAETNNYVRTILGGSHPGGLSRPSESASNGFLPGRASVRIGNKSIFDRAGYQQAQRRTLLANFLQRQGKGNSVLFRSGLLSTTPPNPADFQSNQITSKLIQGRGRQIGFNAPNLKSGFGKVSISPTADRPGVHIRKGIVRFVERVAGIYGRRLTIGTGTNHSRMTVNGNVSDHWDGYAADIPLTGGALIKAGQDALIAAGMNPHKARRQHGGLYNVGGYQVIFNTHIGGDHTNHLHVGKRH